MAICPACHRTVVKAHLSKETTVLLEPGPLVYVTVEEHHIFPEDGDRVFLSTGLVLHTVLCPAARRHTAAPAPTKKGTKD